jgi:hypothetical protein
MISLMETQKLSHCIGRTFRVAVGASQSRRMQSSGLTSLIYGTIIAFELQQLIWIKVLWDCLPGEVGGQPPIYSLLFISSQLLPRAPRQRSFYVTQP